MLYSLLTSLIDTFTFLNVFKVYYLQDRFIRSYVSDYNILNWYAVNQVLRQKTDHRSNKTRWSNRSYSEKKWNTNNGRTNDTDWHNCEYNIMGRS